MSKAEKELLMDRERNGRHVCSVDEDVVTIRPWWCSKFCRFQAAKRRKMSHANRSSREVLVAVPKF